MSVGYNTDHLTYDEVKAIMTEVHKQYLDARAGRVQSPAILSASADELHDEYVFWAGVFERCQDAGQQEAEDD